MEKKIDAVKQILQVLCTMAPWYDDHFELKDVGVVAGLRVAFNRTNGWMKKRRGKFKTGVDFEDAD